MATIGTAYINIAPNMTGIQGKIAGGLRGTGSQFADQFGGEISGRSAVVIGAISGLVSSATSAGLNLMSSQFSAAINRFDTIQNFPKVMQNFGINTTDASDAMKVLVAGVHSLPTSLNDIVSLTEAFTPMSKGVGQAAKLALALNDALLAGGAPMQVQQAAMEQFRQALAKGMPQLQDWRSLESAMPAQLQQVAKALGLGSGALKDYGANGQGLYNAMQDGKISMTDFNNTLLSLDQKGLGTLPNFQTQAKNASNGIATSFTVLKQSIQQVMVDIMTSIGQQNIANAIKGVGTAIKTAYQDIKGVIEFVVRNKDVFGPLAAGIGAVAVAMGIWKGAIATWTAITKVATAVQAAFDAVMAANPITIIVLAIIGLVAALTYFFTQTKVGKQIWADFTAFLSATWNALKVGFAAVASFFSGIWNAISGAVSGFIQWFSDHWRLIIAIVLGPLGLLIDFVTAYWSQITGAISTAVNFVFGVISSVFNAIAGFMAAVFGPPIHAIVAVFQWLGGIVGSIVGGIWNGITAAFGAVTGFLAGVGSKIIGLFTGAGSWLYNTGKDIINGLINGATSLLSKIGNMFLDIIPGWIKGPFKKALGISSPSKVFAGFGGNITDGLVNGITAKAGAVTDAVGTLASNAMAGMAGVNLGAEYAANITPAPAYAPAGGPQQPSDNSPAVVQNNNIYNQVDLNSVTRELAWQIRR